MSTEPGPRRYGVRLTLVEWLVVIAIIGVVVGLLQPASTSGRGGAHTVRAVRRNMRQLGMALHSYHDRHGRLPPAYTTDAQGRPMHSWRVLVLPFLDEQALYDRINFAQPWEAPANRLLADAMPHVFIDPRNPGSHTTGMTPYQAVVGSQTMWPGPHAGTLADIKDGTSNTLAAVESPTPVRWMEPKDVSLAEWTGAAGGGTLPSRVPPGRACTVLYADGGALSVSTDEPRDELRRLATANGGKLHPALKGKPLPGEVINPAPDVAEQD